MNCFRFLGRFLILLLAISTSVFAQDPGWPRKLEKPGGTAIIYQPQVDDWKDYSTINMRVAFQLTPIGGKQVIGAATMTGNTNVDKDKHMVFIYGIKVTNTYFPSLEEDASASMDQLFKTFVPEVFNISLERIVAYMPKPESVPTVNVKNDPPFVFVNYSPAVLLAVDGEPVQASIKDTKLKFIVNTQWAVFQDTKSSEYYMLAGPRWLTAADLHGPWSAATKLPKDMEKLPKDPQWTELKKVIPLSADSNAPIPKVFYSTVPAEVILFNGKPVYAKIPQTQLLYATNTDSPFFLYTPTNEYYYLTSGRWFRSKDMQGKWSFASTELPEDFAKIPRSSPASAVLSSVPGTEEAKDAVLIAQVPTVMEINPKSAAAQAKVSYSGDPQFAPIEGTSLYYATNTSDKVIKVGDVYYLCLQGVWFMSPNAQGPWTTASSIPQEIYTIPPSSPVYNVTYVTQTTSPSGTVYCSHTAGYTGTYVVGVTVVYTTGYYYPPYMYYPPYGYPVYYPYPRPYGYYGYGSFYNTNGSYGVYHTAYGPYGSATRAASYNPYTGTYKQGTSVATPYGRQTVGQAYNPYTGTYAATHQGSSPTAQWGQSYVSNGNKSAYTQHYSTAQGTVGSVQGSQGGKAAGVSTAYGNAAVGKSSNGDMYAGKDGNVYKNTGSGWQKYDNSSGSWNSVNKPQNPNSQSNAQQARPSSPQPSPTATQQRPQTTNQTRPASTSTTSTQNLNSEMQNRQRGSAQASNYQRSSGASSGTRTRTTSGGGGARRR